MKNILTVLIALTITATAFGQKYTTNNVSEYQQVTSNKYSLVDVSTGVMCKWEVSDKRISRTCYANGESADAGWEVSKKVKIPTGNKYILHDVFMDDAWVIITNSGFIEVYENGGVTMRKFKISKKEALK